MEEVDEVAVSNVLGVVDHGGHPVMTLDWNGKPVKIHHEQKPALVRAGLVFLGPEWEAVTTPIPFGDAPSTTMLPGFTNDREIYRLYRAFELEVRLGTFKPGPRS